MGLVNEYKLRSPDSDAVITVIPIGTDLNRVFGLYEHYGLEEYLVTDDRLEEIKRQYHLRIAEQTSIFDFL